MKITTIREKDKLASVKENNLTIPAKITFKKCKKRMGVQKIYIFTHF